MTRIEKETVLKALAHYKDAQRKQETATRRKGELKKAAEHTREACIADALISAFCSILDEPCGTCSI